METPFRSARLSEDVCPWIRVRVQLEWGSNRMVACNVTRAGCILPETCSFLFCVGLMFPFLSGVPMETRRQTNIRASTEYPCR